VNVFFALGAVSIVYGLIGGHQRWQDQLRVCMWLLVEDAGRVRGGHLHVQRVRRAGVERGRPG